MNILGKSHKIYEKKQNTGKRSKRKARNHNKVNNTFKTFICN